jgi:hypothetical protein
LVAICDAPQHRVWPSRTAWLAMLVGGVLAIYVFMEDALRMVPQGVAALMELRPTRFDWPLFLLALVCLCVPVLELAWRSRSGARLGSRTHNCEWNQ